MSCGIFSEQNQRYTYAPYKAWKRRIRLLSMATPNQVGVSVLLEHQLEANLVSVIHFAFVSVFYCINYPFLIVNPDGAVVA